MNSLIKTLIIFIILVLTNSNSYSIQGIKGYVYTIDSKPLENVEIVASRDFSTKEKVKSNAKGYFYLQLEPGEYKLSVVEKGFKDFSIGKITIKKDTWEKETIALEQIISDVQGIKGTISNTKQYKIPDVNIEIFNEKNMRIKLLKSDITGFFEYNLNPGIYSLKLTKTNFKELNISSITVEKDTFSRENYMLEYSQGIHGKIINKQKESLAGITVQFYENKKKINQLNTDTSGYFKWDYLPGNYIISVSSNIYFNYSKDNIRLKSGKWKEINIKLRKNLKAYEIYKSSEAMAERQVNRDNSILGIILMCFIGLLISAGTGMM